MRGRKPSEYSLTAGDRQLLAEGARYGQGQQRGARRAQALLALDRGERSVDSVHWSGRERTSLGYLWQRYQQRGSAAIVDAPRSGRPRIFSPSAARRKRRRSLHRSARFWEAGVAVGLSHLATSRGRAGSRRFQPLDNPRPHAGAGQFAASSQSVLEDRATR